MEHIEILFGPDGTATVAPKGIKGKKCTEITKELEEALGVVTKREHTAEWYQTETARVAQKAGGKG